MVAAKRGTDAIVHLLIFVAAVWSPVEGTDGGDGGIVASSDHTPHIERPLRLTNLTRAALLSLGA